MVAKRARGRFAWGMSLPLSVSIICRNSESTIGRTLESVAGLGTEIVGVDSGSTDGTIDLLERVGAKVIRTPWLGYIKTKQLALDSCSQPWILCLDSDESVEPELAESVRDVVGRDPPGVAGWFVNRRIYYCDRQLKYAWQPEWRLRLVRRGRARWTGVYHDSLEVIPPAAGEPGGVDRLKGVLRHDSFTTFAAWLPKQVEHARLTAEAYYEVGKRAGVMGLPFRPAAAFLKQMVLKQAWRDGWPGWLAAASVAAYVLMKHMTLVELTKRGNGRAVK